MDNATDFESVDLGVQVPPESPDVRVFRMARKMCLWLWWNDGRFVLFGLGNTMAQIEWLDSFHIMPGVKEEAEDCPCRKPVCANCIYLWAVDARSLLPDDFLR